MVFATDETGAKPISNTEWSELFNLVDDKVEWDTTQMNSQLKKAKDEVTDEQHTLIEDVLFARNYFALEETGIGYPCFTPKKETNSNKLDAILRVLLITIELLQINGLIKIRLNSGLTDLVSVAERVKDF